MPKKKSKKKTEKKAKRRVVLGEGHPWFFSSDKRHTDSVYLTEKPVASFILARGGETTVGIDWDDLGNWNRVRLVIEVLE